MSTNIVNKSPFLRTSRNFPEDAQPLAVETNKSYVDIANAVNSREISIYPSGRPAQNGQTWYLTSQAQNAFRQIYYFTVAGNIPHGIMWPSVYLISPRSYGSYTDGTNHYGVIYSTSGAIAGKLSFYVTPLNIVIEAGAGAPAVSYGIIDLEWIAQA